MGRQAREAEEEEDAEEEEEDAMEAADLHPDMDALRQASPLPAKPLLPRGGSAGNPRLHFPAAAKQPWRASVSIVRGSSSQLYSEKTLTLTLNPKTSSSSWQQYRKT
jgi:hypothetical protein